MVFNPAQSQKGRIDEILKAYEISQADTARVRILLHLDSLYLYRMPDTDNILDSAILLAEQAKSLSNDLHFEPGIYEASFLIANAYAEKKDMVTAQALAERERGSLQVHMLIMLGERYLFRPGEIKKNLDSAYIFAVRAKNLSESLGSVKWVYESSCLLGKYYFAIGQTDKAKACFMKMVNEYHLAGDDEREANWWSELGGYMPDNDSTYGDEVHAFEKALLLYSKLGLKREARSALGNIAYLHERHKNLSLAEKGFAETLKMSIELGDTVLFERFVDLSELNRVKGNYDKSLYYALQAVKNVNALSDVGVKGTTYYNLAEAYRALKETDKSLEWYYAALDNLVTAKMQYLFSITGHIVNGLIEKNKVDPALNFLNSFVRKNEPVRFSDQEIVAKAFADCFNALGRYDDAERQYLKMIELDERATDHRRNDINSEYMGSGINSSDAAYAIGRFYAERGNYPLAEKYLRQALTNGEFLPILSHLSNVHYMLFKVDSAQGKYVAAINELQMHKNLDDSIFSETKSRQIEELQIQYDTRKKEQDLQVSLANEKLQIREVREASESRKVAYILVSALAALLTVLFSRFRLKQKNNLLLQVQQKKINIQNQVLTDLNNNQQKLLAEKEWLIKEIHHRVKNNLQIVISLLNTQASHLEEGDALLAIQESRHRMQVISLLHQKLYQVETSSLIDMKAYIREVVSYLKECVKGINHLYFIQQIDAITLEIPQAVSVGLILNEAITNCIKYAFPNNIKGNITVSFTIESSNLLLMVADNGIGIADGIDLTKNSSLGMQLMQTLSEQLDGKIKIERIGGTVVKVCFRRQMIEKAGFNTENVKNL